MNKRSAARWDLVIVVLATTVTAILSTRLNLSEALVRWTRPHENLQLDELPGILLVLAACLVWFALRRYLEARREIVARRQVEASLVAALSENRRVARQYTQMQESERRALARDLHDELGQYLNAVKLDVVSLRERLASVDPDAARQAAEAIGNIDHIQSVVIALIRQLRPVGLDELGLSAAVEHCVDEWRRRLPQVSIGLRVSEGIDDGLDEMRRLAIYRLVQEALTNVARHSKATHVEVGIAREHGESPARLVVCVADDGIGEDPGRPGSGLGLIGMRERMEAVGGSLVVNKAANAGFTLRGQVPFGVVP